MTTMYVSWPANLYRQKPPAGETRCFRRSEEEEAQCQAGRCRRRLEHVARDAESLTKAKGAETGELWPTEWRWWWFWWILSTFDDKGEEDDEVLTGGVWTSTTVTVWGASRWCHTWTLSVYRVNQWHFYLARGRFKGDGPPHNRKQAFPAYSAGIAKILPKESPPTFILCFGRNIESAEWPKVCATTQLFNAKHCLLPGNDFVKKKCSWADLCFPIFCSAMYN